MESRREPIWSVPREVQDLYIFLFALQVVAAAVFVGLDSVDSFPSDERRVALRALDYGVMLLGRLSGIVIASAGLSVVLVEAVAISHAIVTRPLRRRLVLAWQFCIQIGGIARGASREVEQVARQERSQTSGEEEAG